MKTMKISFAAIVICLAFLLNVKNTNAQAKSDKEAIKISALNYIEGWYSADTARMSKALSNDLKKRGFLIHPKTGELVVLDATFEQMIEWTGKNKNQLAENPKLRIDVEIIDVGENIAMVKTIAPDFIDYIHMGKKEGEWKIYNVIWEPTKKDSE